VHRGHTRIGNRLDQGHHCLRRMPPQHREHGCARVGARVGICRIQDAEPRPRPRLLEPARDDRRDHVHDGVGRPAVPDDVRRPAGQRAAQRVDERGGPQLL
jgi:hypothetical protein